MKTVSVNIENLCVPCHCGCRHCLLSSQHRATGVDYERGEAFARKFYCWLSENRPDLSGMYYVGYCMDFPELPQYISYFRGQTGMAHLMFDGIGMRSEQEAREFLETIRNAGIREIHLTFYGTESYHDRFAGRKGDFRYMTMITKLSLEAGMRVTAGVMVTRENMDQMEELFDYMDAISIENTSLILPHAKGRGAALSHLRLTADDFDRLSPRLQQKLPRNRYLTEAQWIANGEYPAPEERHLTLSLTPENIDRLEQMPPSAMIRELEEMDDAYYAVIPDMQTLAESYGRRENQQLFRFRDLYLEWQVRYLEEHPFHPNVNDERYSFSTRVFP